MRGLWALASVAVTAVSLLLGAPARAVGQASLCTSPMMQRGLDRIAQFDYPLLYDGVSALRQQPTTPVVFAATAGCVLLTVQLSKQGGDYVVGRVGSVAVEGPRNNRARVVPAMVRAAEQVLRGVINQGVFPIEPDGAGDYAVAIPLWDSHPLYQTWAGATPDVSPDAVSAPQTLADRGWPDSRLLYARAGLAVYHLAERGEFLAVAAVRDIGPDEPILDFQEAEGSFGAVQQYGPETRRRFLEEIVPVLKPSAGRAQSVNVWTYASGDRVPRPEAASFVFARATHPITGSDQVEMPISIEEWQGIRRDPSQPLEWRDRNQNGVRGAAHNTIAVIRALYERDAERAATAARVRAERDAREATERNTRLAEQAVFEARKAALYREAGLIYLDPTYWESLEMGAELRAVFEGDFPNAVREWEFGRIYRFVIGNYSARCRAFIPPNSPRVVSTEIETRDGTARITDQDTTYIRREFAEPYRWWDEDSPRALADLPSGLAEVGVALPGSNVLSDGLQATGQLTRATVALRSDMDVLFGEGCEAAVLEQFMENMRRLALSAPTLQVEHIPQVLPDPLRPRGTLAGACGRYIDENGFIVDDDWCPCLEDVFRARTTAGERWGYVLDYRLFFRRVDTLPDGGATDPDWAFYEPANACRR